MQDHFYEFGTKTIQNVCKVFKTMGGRWSKYCGFLDGEKLVCMDGLYEAFRSRNCLVYSFGLADDWDFEILMAQLGILLT